MRILMTTRGSAGHVLPLAPFGHAALRAGHEVLVAAQRQHHRNVERTRLPFSPLEDPPAGEWMPLMEEFSQLRVDAANARMIGEFFGRIDTRAALPGLRAIVERWRPDLIVRESWEFASTLVAEASGIPLARVGLGLASVEELSIRLAAASVVLGLPGPEVFGELPTAVRRVLDDDGYRRRAGRIAEAVRALPTVDAAVDALAAIRAEPLRTSGDRNVA